MPEPRWDSECRSAAANPKPKAPSRVNTRQVFLTGCADQLRDLTIELRDVGLIFDLATLAPQ